MKHEILQIKLGDATEEWKELFWYAFCNTSYSDNYPYNGAEIGDWDGEYKRWFNLLKEVSNGSQEFIINALVGSNRKYLLVQFHQDKNEYSGELYEYFIVEWSNGKNLEM